MSLFTRILVSINVVPFGEVWIIFIENNPRSPCETQGKIYANESNLGELSQIKLLKWLLCRLLQPNRHSFITAVFLWRSFFPSFILLFFLPFIHFFISSFVNSFTSTRNHLFEISFSLLSSFLLFLFHDAGRTVTRNSRLLTKNYEGLLKLLPESNTYQYSIALTKFNYSLWNAYTLEANFNSIWF